MKTRITELSGIQHPIIQGGMHYVGFAELAAAVSNAGGLGIITGLTQKTPQDLANEIARCHDMTKKPFGVNLTFLPTVSAPDYPGYVSAIIDGGVKHAGSRGADPGPPGRHARGACRKSRLIGALPLGRGQPLTIRRTPRPAFDQPDTPPGAH